MTRPDLALGMSLGRAAAELAIIVAGVLIALGAQSWWESRERASDRSAALASLRGDLTLIDSELAGRLQRVDTTEADIRWILAPETDFAAEPDSVFNLRLQYALWEVVGAEVALPSYEDLKGSGRLGLLPPVLRAGLAELETQVRMLHGTDDDNFQYQIRNLDPWLLDNAPLRDVLDYDDVVTGRAPERMSAALLRSRRVENMLLAKLELAGNLRSRIGVVREHAAALVASIDSLEAPGR